MFTDPRQKKVLEELKKHYSEHKPDALHDIDHSLRDVHWAKILSKKEKADLTITIPATLLHDIAIPIVGDPTHAQIGSELCKPILKRCGYTENEIERIAHAILMHSTDDPNPKSPEAIEDRVVFDADKLDATGPAALHRWFFEYHKQGYLHHEAVKKILEHIQRWKKKYGDPPFYTKTARLIGKMRFKYTEKTCKEILKDLEKFKDFYKFL